MGIRARRTAAVAAVAVVTLVSLAALAWDRLAGPDIATDGSATLDGLRVDVRAAEWVPMEHVDPGFQVPGQMMPGAPEGDEVRLGITITLSNTDARTREFNLVDEFTLTGGRGTEPVALSADTIGTLPRLGPGAGVAGTLYFDVEAPGDEDPPLYLLWSRDGVAVRIALPSTGEAPDHGHG
jgi:hypothetical protein